MFTTFVALALLALADPPTRDEPPGKEELQGVTDRGRDLAGFDAALWHSSDAVEDTRPRPGLITSSIARKTDKGWMVAFGRLDKEKGEYHVAYEATPSRDPEEFDIEAINPPRVETGFFRSAAWAIDTALKDFKQQRRAYNVAVLPAGKDQFHVYVIPAPTKPGVWPLGGDARYLVSGDGRTILDKRTLHKTIIEVERPKGDKNQLVSGVHTHVLDDTVEDTDVFHVLARKPSVPEIVVGKPFSYEVGVDGSIKVLGKTDDLLRKK